MTNLAVTFHCGTRPRKVCRPQFRRTQRASGLRPSRRSLPRGLHGPDRELDRYATRSASAGGCRKSGWLTAASRRLPDRRVQNVWSVTVYVRSVLITSTVDPSKRYTRHDHVGGMARSLCRHTGRADGKKSSMGSENRRRRFRGNLKSSVTRSIAPEGAALENRRYLPKRLLLPQSSRRDADGDAERLRVINEFRDLRSQTWGD